MERIAALEKLIRGYRQSYYGGEAEIPDSEYDLIEGELKALDPGNPLLAEVGHEGSPPPGGEGGQKIRHLIPMGSQDKAANPEEFRAWAAKTGLSAFMVQHKLDGASLELQYADGRLAKAVTRGDGIVGEDITANARLMAGVPDALDEPFSGGVRGEVVMAREVWRARYKDKANCRNAANGIMRRKDGAGCEDLALVAYDATRIDAAGTASHFGNEARKLEWLRARGFRVAESTVLADTEEVIAHRDAVAAGRGDLPFDIDGLVVKDVATDLADLRRARPERQIAFKFELEVAFSRLRQVEWSESGATYTPIGVVDPVRIAGTTVRRANLNNPDMIRSLGLKIGSAVSVVKRGEIIPKIEGLAPDGALPLDGTLPPLGGGEETPIEFPTECSSCGAALVDSGTRLYCPGASCPKRLLHRLEKWVKVLDIREIGDKLLAQIFGSGLARTVADLYSLEPAVLADFERMGELSAAKVVRNIRTQRRLSLAAFVAGFDLEGVAETTMEKVSAAGFDTLEKLRAACAEDLAAIHGLGDITARTIAEGLAETAAEMDAVLAAGPVTIAEPPPASLPFSGLSFCFTGELPSMKRAAAEERIKGLGASARTSVAKGLSYLVAGDPESSSAKNRKARELGVPILGEEGFLAMLAAAEAVEEGGIPSGGGQGELF